MSTGYIETSVPSYYIARPSQFLVQASGQSTTRAWWDGGCSGLDLYTSLEAVDEAGRGDEALAMARLELLDGILLLKIDDEVAALSAELVGSSLIPPSAGSDAVHIAAAAVHGMEFLVTWKFKHIANPFLRDRLRSAVEGFGASLPVICTPEELHGRDEED